VLQLYAYLKPSVAATGGRSGGARGGKVPGRIRMELTVPQGGAIGRGNMPSDGPRNLPAMPEIPEESADPATPVGAGGASSAAPLS
jgi:hypothetical protein